MVTEHFTDKWAKYPANPNNSPHTTTTVYPYHQGQSGTVFPGVGTLEQLMAPKVPKIPAISKEEIEEFRKLLERAREYDKKNNEPFCELEEKKKKLKDIVEKLGAEIDFL